MYIISVVVVPNPCNWVVLSLESRFLGTNINIAGGITACEAM